TQFDLPAALRTHGDGDLFRPDQPGNRHADGQGNYKSGRAQGDAPKPFVVMGAGPSRQQHAGAGDGPVEQDGLEGSDWVAQTGNADGTSAVDAAKLTHEQRVDEIEDSMRGEPQHQRQPEEQ